MFQGFSQMTQEFLWGIRFNNQRDWFNQHKQAYQDHVVAPMDLLGRQVLAAMEGKLPRLELRQSRIYRDARRLHGRGPYKDHMWIVLAPPREEQGPAFYFEVAPEGCTLGMGWYDAGSVTMAKLRARIQRDPKPLERLTRQLKKDGRFTLEGEQFKRSKGDVGALLQPWYDRKSIALCRVLPWGELVFTPALAQEVTDCFTFLIPYYEYLDALSQEADPRVP